MHDLYNLQMDLDYQVFVYNTTLVNHKDAFEISRKTLTTEPFFSKVADLKSREKDIATSVFQGTL